MRDDLVADLMFLPGKYPGHMDIRQDLVYLLGCGSFQQFCATLRSVLAPETHCSFCNRGLQKKPPKGADWSSSRRWYWKKNDFHGGPQEGLKEAVLVIPARHITKRSELTEADWADATELFMRVCDELKIEGGGFFMRFGDPHFHVGTIPHIHANILAPTGEKAYRPPLAKDEQDWVKNYQRLLRHRDELTEKGGIKWLFSDTGIAHSHT